MQQQAALMAAASQGTYVNPMAALAAQVQPMNPLAAAAASGLPNGLTTAAMTPTTAGKGAAIIH